MPTRILLLLCLTTLMLPAQQGDQGDKAGENQKPLVPRDQIPRAPVLPPAEALKTFKLAPGFRIELVASEPLVHDPVQIAFDPDGRLWVLEMSGFMPNADGQGEFEKIGKVVVLEDADGDGRMDRRTVFLDGLVMPRAIALVADGVLVAEPPKLWFYKNEGGKAGHRMEVAGDYAAVADPKLGARANPEHAANGLLWALDNWIYSANHTTRFRLMDGEWQRQPTIFRGQWGIAQDDFGRLVYNSNSDQLRVDLVPSAYLSRNPFVRGAAGVNVQTVKDQEVWPIRMNPGVNRGYRPGQLRTNDWSLATYTAACGPLIYRGDNFPADCQGNAFICEPSGNLVRRNILTEAGGMITARNAYEKAEFLASTDERFRPVNLNTGPDGALYVVDFYRGIIQHRIYLTSYLRQQAEDRGLEKPTGLGRIYRVVHDSKPLGRSPQLAHAGPEQLVQQLSHPNGWWRDTAQRLLVERSTAASLAPLKKLATTGAEPLGRLHALWTLEGMGQLDADTLLAVLRTEPHPKVRAAAIRLCEPFLKTSEQAQLLPRLLAESNSTAVDVLLQLAFTLGEVKEPSAEQALAALARDHAGNIYLRDAVLTSLGLRELEFLERLQTDKSWSAPKPGGSEIFSALAKAIFLQAKSERVNRLLEFIAAPAAVNWQRDALLEGIVATTPKGNPPPKTRRVRLPAEPPALAALKAIETKSVRASVSKLEDMITWPGQPGAEPEPEIKPLTAEQKEQFEFGKSLYDTTCAACHQAHGYGQEGLSPPLVDSEWVAGKVERLARIILHGVRGTISVKGQKYDLDMPALGTFDDDQMAGILTYIRRAWGHTLDPVEPATIKKIRAATAQREEAWSEAELLKIR